MNLGSPAGMIDTALTIASDMSFVWIVDASVRTAINQLSYTIGLNASLVSSSIISGEKFTISKVYPEGACSVKRKITEQVVKGGLVYTCQNVQNVLSILQTQLMTMTQ